MVGGLKEFKLDPQGIADFAKSLGDGIVGVVEWVRPHWQSFVEDFVKPILDALSEVIAWSQRKTNIHARAAASGFNYTKLREGDAAEANMAQQEKNARIGMKQYGFSLPAAYELGSYQEIAGKAFAEQQAAEKTMAAARFAMDTTADPGSKARYGKDVRRSERDIAEALSVRAKADEIVQKIIASGTKTVAPAKLSKDAQAITDRRARTDAGPIKKPPGGNFGIERMKLEPHLAELAPKLTKDLENPVAKFSQDLADLDAIRAAGALTEDNYAMAYGNSLKELADKAGAGNQPQLARSVELGSQQLANMVSRAGIGTGPRSVEGLLKMMNDQMAQQVAVSKTLVAQGGSKVPVINAPE